MGVRKAAAVKANNTSQKMHLHTRYNDDNSINVRREVYILNTLCKAENKVEEKRTTNKHKPKNQAEAKG